MEKLLRLSDKFCKKNGRINHLIGNILWIPVRIYAAYLEHRIK